MPMTTLPKLEEIRASIRGLKAKRSALRSQLANTDETHTQTNEVEESRLKRLLGKFYRIDESTPQSTVDREAITREIDEVEEGLNRLRPIMKEARAAENVEARTATMPDYRRKVRNLVEVLDRAAAINAEVEALASQMGEHSPLTWRALRQGWWSGEESLSSYRARVTKSRILEDQSLLAPNPVAP